MYGGAFSPNLPIHQPEHRTAETGIRHDQIAALADHRKRHAFALQHTSGPKKGVRSGRFQVQARRAAKPKAGMERQRLIVQDVEARNCGQVVGNVVSDV